MRSMVEGPTAAKFDPSVSADALPPPRSREDFALKVSEIHLREGFLSFAE